MFHTFETRSPIASGPTPNPPRRPRVNKSCSECMRRKVKCDGGQPCTTCQYYRISDTCVYPHRSRRQATSRSALDKATETIRRQAGVLQCLFPNASLDDLVGKERSQLLQILSQDLPDASHLAAAVASGRSSPTASVPGQAGDPDGAASDRGDPEEERHWDELENPTTIAVSDDINAIGLAGDRHRRSYLGICSVSAVLRALFRLCPGAKDRIVEASRLWPDVQQETPSSLLTPAGAAVASGSDPLREMRYVGFYFEHIHAITPFLHEESFRATVANGDRQTHAWLGLYNMVLTVGSIASGSDTAHIHYYNQARIYLDLDSLGSGNLETLQALCLLGGYYLHYRNSPNMAYAILGAAQRLAIALGLHRESHLRTDPQDPETAQRYAIRIEARRRTWWSLYCLDTWASMTLGRPTCGRWDVVTMNTSLPTPLHPDDHVAISLKASAEFCHIGNRVQHLFAQSTRIGTHVAQSLDRELTEWYASIDPALMDTANAPPRMAVAREFLRNRYYNLRLILSRCFLLYMAYDSSKKRDEEHHRHQSVAEVELGNLCRSIAAEAIDAIALHWVPNRTQVWNSAWYLFQACMVPLLSIAMGAEATFEDGGIHDSSNASTPMAAHYTTLTKALTTFAEMKPWLRASDRAANIVEALVQAVSHVPDAGRDQSNLNNHISMHTPSVSDGGLHLFGLPDEFLTEMDWSAVMDGADGDFFGSLGPLT
ncbi:fungal-specific transcription factor domain-containing protein [Aspergillus carlsbadensis]|nr:fungal-specific transcription factor domain-containing protein [Aspergillus carlsbadensis]